MSEKDRAEQSEGDSGKEPVETTPQQAPPQATQQEQPQQQKGIMRVSGYPSVVAWYHEEPIDPKNLEAGNFLNLMMVRGTDGRIALPHIYVNSSEDIRAADIRFHKTVLRGVKPPNEFQSHIYHDTQSGKLYLVNIVKGITSLPRDEEKPGDLFWLRLPISDMAILESIHPWCIEILNTLITRTKKE